MTEKPKHIALSNFQLAYFQERQRMTYKRIISEKDDIIYNMNHLIAFLQNCNQLWKENKRTAGLLPEF